jgi:hypothetical protein
MKFAVFSLFTFLFHFAHAYTLSTTSDGRTTQWRSGQKLFLAGNPSNSDGHSSDLFREAVVNALQQWRWATHGVFDFEYWQGTNPSVYPSSQGQDGMSSIFFASHSRQPIDPNVIGYTQVWYNSNTGDLIEADVLLNDVSFNFTNSKGDTSSSAANKNSNRPNIYLNNVVTHELGHAIGLSHSGSINSSMLYVEYSEQAKIGCDDWAGARHLYPSPNSGTGVLTGTVLSPYGERLAGAQITAISKSRGTPIASVHSDQSGQFTFGALEAGTVALLIEPFQGSKSSIPSRVQARNSTPVCSGNTYPVNFYTQGDEHQLVEIPVRANQVNPAGAIQIQCDPVSDSHNLYASGAPDMLVDQASAGSTRSYYYRANGAFQITGIGYLLLSPIRVNLAVYDSQGRAIPVQVQSPLYLSDSNFLIPDSQITGSANGVIELRVTTASIPQTQFPVPSLWPDLTPYYVITYNSGNLHSSSALPFDARCSAPESFAAYASPNGDPIRNSATQSSRDGAGFCNNAQAAERGADRRPVKGGSILGWFFPFYIAFAAQLYFRRRTVRLKST